MEPLRIRLDEDKRAGLIRALQDWSSENLDRELSDLGARLLLDFFLRELGAPVYNQAVGDVRGWFQDKLDDLEGEFHEPEQPLRKQ